MSETYTIFLDYHIPLCATPELSRLTSDTRLAQTFAEVNLPELDSAEARKAFKGDGIKIIAPFNEIHNLRLRVVGLRPVGSFYNAIVAYEQ